MLALFYLESMYLAGFFESRVSHRFAECRPFSHFYSSVMRVDLFLYL